MGKWRTEYASECGHEVHLLEDWVIPKFCKECKAEYEAQFYEKECEECHRQIRVSRNWEHIPRFCKECKAEYEAQSFEKECEGCGKVMRVSRTWEHVPRFCRDCKNRYEPIYAKCSHCGDSFTISVATQINCKNNDWDLPKKCKACRELFKHKPFKTMREVGLAGVVFKTYNSLGQLISTSYDVNDFGTQKRIHQSTSGHVTGWSTKEDHVFGKQVRNVGVDGKTKSISREEEFLGDRYTESTGGSSQTKHKTRSKRGFWGLFRKTE